MKSIIKALIMAVITAIIPLVFTSCEDDWDDDNGSVSQDNKFDYIYSCIGKKGQAVIANIQNDGYAFSEKYDYGTPGIFYHYNKSDNNSGVTCQYYFVVQNNVVKCMGYHEVWDYGKADCKKVKDNYTQMIFSANNRVSPTMFVGEVKIVPYGSTSGEWVAYFTASDLINAIKNYTITNNCMGSESVSAHLDMEGSEHYVWSELGLHNRLYDDYPEENEGPYFDIEVFDLEWYENDQPEWKKQERINAKCRQAECPDFAAVSPDSRSKRLAVE